MPFITHLSISKLITKNQEDLLYDKSICLINTISDVISFFVSKNIFGISFRGSNFI